MKIIKPSYKILSNINGINILKTIENAARVCYKSENKISIDDSSAKKLLKILISAGHEAMLEHASISVKFIVDRGVSHELVRHRLCSFAQESTRYCNYADNKFGNELTFIEPFFYTNKQQLFDIWKNSCQNVENNYLTLLKLGSAPQEARSILPNSIKTEIVVTANLREWRKIFILRCASDAHPQMREIMIPLLNELKIKIPLIFDDLDY